jgi:hypothetical protein
MSLREQKISEIQKYGQRGRGRSELIGYLEGKPMTNLKRIRAKCYDCMSYYSDGKEDCKNSDCPLYSVMPYRGGVGEAPEGKL